MPAPNDTARRRRDPAARLVAQAKSVVAQQRVQIFTDLEASNRELALREAKIEEAERQAQKAAYERDDEIAAQDGVLHQRAINLDTRERELNRWQKKTEDAIEKADAAMKARENTVERETKNTNQREAALDEREAKLDERDEILTSREEIFEDRIAKFRAIGEV